MELARPRCVLWVTGVVLACQGLAALSGRTDEGQGPGAGGIGEAGPALARAMVERCRAIRSLRAEMEATAAGERLEARNSGTLVLSRPADGSAEKIRVRIDLKPRVKVGQDPPDESEVVLGATGAQTVAWLPRERRVTRGEAPPGTRRWDGFANPLLSLLALVAPNEADLGSLERTFMLRVRQLPDEPLEGRRCVRLRGPAAFGARVDFWLDPADLTPRRIELSQEPAPRSGARGCRIEIGGVDEPVAEERLAVPVPKDARASDPAAEFDAGASAKGRARKRAAARVELPSEDLAPLIQRLRAQVAKKPKETALRLRLADACHQAGRGAEAEAALRQGVAANPAPETFEEVWEAAAGMARWSLALEFLRQGAARHGERFLERLDEENTDIAWVAERAGQEKETAAALRAALPTAGDPWAARARLVRLSAAVDNRPGTGEAFRELLAPETPPGGMPPERAAAIRSVLEELRDAGWPWPPAADGAIAAALRGAEVSLAEEALQPLAELYLAVGAPEEAARVLQSPEPYPWTTTPLLAAAAGALRARGRAAEGEGLLRLGLAHAVDVPWGTAYRAILPLLEARDNQQVLKPVLRELAVFDRRQDRWEAAKWRYLAGDFGEAAAACEDALAEAPGAGEPRPPGERLAIITVGLDAARRAGDASPSARLEALALAELPYAAMDLRGGFDAQRVVLLLLDQLRDRPGYGPALLALARECPEMWYHWRAHAAGVPSAGPTVREALPFLAVRADRYNTLTEMRVYTLHGFPEEAAGVLIDQLGRGLADRECRLLAQVAGQLSRPEPLLTALRQAVAARPDWAPGALALAEALRLTGDAEGALAVLRAAPRQDPAAARLLAENERRASNTAGALRVLREALAARPAEPGLLVSLARMLTEDGRTAEALPLWRKVPLAVENHGANRILAVADGLRRCGAPAEARASLRRALQAVPDAEWEAAEGVRDALAAAYLADNQPEAALRLYPEIVRRVVRDDPDFGAAHMEEDRDPGVRLVARALERLGHPRAARRAYALLAVQGEASAADRLAHLRLAARTGALAEAHALRQFHGGGSPEDPRNLVQEALLDEAEGRGARLDVYRAAVYPAGQPFPHLSQDAEIACLRLAEALEREGKPEEARRCRGWAEAMALAGSADDDSRLAAPPREWDRIQALFPESPCLTLRRATLAGRADPSRWSSSGPEPSLVLKALDQLLPVADGVRGCSVCWWTLHSGEIPAGLIDSWLERHPRDARAYFLAGSLAGERSGENSVPRRSDPARAERLLGRAVALDAGLIAAWAQLREAREALGDGEGQVLAAERVAAARPADVEALVALSHATTLAGRAGEAEAIYRRARALDPGLAWRYLQRARGGASRRHYGHPVAGADEALRQNAYGSLRWVAPNFQPVWAVTVSAGRLAVH